MKKFIQNCEGRIELTPKLDSLTVEVKGFRDFFLIDCDQNRKKNQRKDRYIESTFLHEEIPITMIQKKQYNNTRRQNLVTNALVRIVCDIEEKFWL